MPRRERTTRSFEDALDLVLHGIEPLLATVVPLQEALGLVSAESITSAFASPAFPQAAMDGFAVVSSDLNGASQERPVRLRIGGTVAAGQIDIPDGGPETCLRIMTGALCPPPFDAVLPWELVAVEGDEIKVTFEARPGHHIRAVGESLAVGTPLISAGDVLSPAHLGLAASDGRATIAVVPRAMVVLLTIGDELTEPGQDPGPSGVWDSNSVMVAALIRQFGGELIDHLRLKDDLVAIEAGLLAAAEMGPNLIVTVGGASSSERDILGQIDHLDIALQCLDVMIRPGRPLVTGRVRGVPMIGLPGNPGAAFNSAWQFVRPVIRQMAGLGSSAMPLVRAISSVDIRDEVGRRSFVRVRLLAEAGTLVAHLAGSQSSASQLSLAETDGFLVIGEGQDMISVGAAVAVQVLEPERVAWTLAAALSPMNRVNPAFG